MRVLVTGGAGYIGSHTCKALAAAGHTPIVFDNLRTGHRSAVKWGALVHGDLNDIQSLHEAFRMYRPEAVLHFAALAYVGESVSQPDKYYTTNVNGTLNLLKAMNNHDCETIVFSSTCATYGEPTKMPIVESTRQMPVNPYGWTKLMVEQMLADFERAFGIRHVALRYFNAAGADPDGELGENHDPETHLIPIVLETAAGKRAELSIYGTDYDTPDGTCVRDYVHVSDLAQAHVLALNHACQNESARFNLGTGLGFSVKQIVDAAERVTGRKIRVRAGPRRKGDPPVLVADPAAAQLTLGWKPAFPDAETMIGHAWNWLLRNSD